MTTDPVVDLVAFRNIKQKAVTIQVKTSTQHGKAGDKWLEWEIKKNCPADYVAIVDFDREKFWLISTSEFIQKGEQPTKERSRLWWYIPGHEYGETKKREEEFKEYEMDLAIPRVFGLK